MELEHVNRLPMPTYRYLKTNDSALPFRMPARMGRAVFPIPPSSRKERSCRKHSAAHRNGGWKRLPPGSA